MATRRSSNQSDTTTNQNEEATVAENESTEQSVPMGTDAAQTPAETPAEKPAEAVIDLTDFKAALAGAIEDADTSTGDVPEAPLSKVTAAYRALDGAKAKNAAKAVDNEGMKEAMNSDNLPGARAYMQIQDTALVAGSSGGAKAEKVPADPTEAFVLRVATLNLAYQLVVGDVPEGVNESWSETANAQVGEGFEAAKGYVTWLNADTDSRGDEPEVPVAVKNAAKLAVGKSAKAGGSTRTSTGGSTGDGTRHDIAAHIREAFADKEEGAFMSIADIRKFESTEYGTNLPSAGAISARLFPKGDGDKSTMRKDGIRSTTNENDKKGAVKDASVAGE